MLDLLVSMSKIIKKCFLLIKLGPNSGLHIIIFDEIDAICKARGSVVIT